MIILYVWKKYKFKYIKNLLDYNSNNMTNKLTTKTIDNNSIGSEFKNIFTINDNLTKLKKLIKMNQVK